MSLVFGDEFLAQCLHLKSHQRCSAGIRTWLSADQSSSSTLTESAFLFDPCLIPAVLNSSPRAPPLCIFRMLLLSLQMFVLFERKCPAKWTSQDIPP